MGKINKIRRKCFLFSYSVHIKRMLFFYVCNFVLPLFTLAVSELPWFHMACTASGTHQEKVGNKITTLIFDDLF